MGLPRSCSENRTFSSTGKVAAFPAEQSQYLDSYVFGLGVSWVLLRLFKTLVAPEYLYFGY
jgi:hypothetical protein